MNKFLTYLSFFFLLIGIIFSILPMGTIAFLPLFFSIILIVLTIKNKANTQKKIIKIIIFTSSIVVLIVIGKEVFVKDKVATDLKFKQEQIDSKKDAQKELEGVE